VARGSPRTTASVFARGQVFGADCLLHERTTQTTASVLANE
jgi:hypothetical protein